MTLATHIPEPQELIYVLGPCASQDESVEEVLFAASRWHEENHPTRSPWLVLIGDFFDESYEGRILASSLMAAAEGEHTLFTDLFDRISVVQGLSEFIASQRIPSIPSYEDAIEEAAGCNEDIDQLFDEAMADYHTEADFRRWLESLQPIGDWGSLRIRGSLAHGGPVLGQTGRPGLTVRSAPILRRDPYQETHTLWLTKGASGNAIFLAVVDPYEERVPLLHLIGAEAESSSKVEEGNIQPSLFSPSADRVW